MDYIMLFNAKKSNPSPLPLLLKKRKLLKLKSLYLQAMIYAYASPGGESGSGAGKGGGAGGSIRESGGGFGKMQAVREEEYFRKLQKRQLTKLKQDMPNEISHYRKLIQQHKDAIARLENRIEELQSMPDSDTSKDDSTRG